MDGADRDNLLKRVSGARKSKIEFRATPTRNTLPLRSALARGAEAAGVTDIDPAAVEFGQKIQRLRNQAGITQLRLAELAGMQQSALSDIERGKGREGPSYRVIRQIAQALGAQVSLTPSPIEAAPMDFITDLSASALRATTLRDLDACKAMLRTLMSDDEFTYLADLQRDHALCSHAAGFCTFWRLDAGSNLGVQARRHIIIFASARDQLSDLDTRFIKRPRIALVPEGQIVSLKNASADAATIAAMPGPADAV